MVDEPSTQPKSRAPWVALAIGFVISLAAWQAALRIEGRAIAADLEVEASERALAVEQQLIHDLAAVESVVAAFEAAPSLDRAHFSSLTAHLLARHRSLRAIGWDPIIEEHERADFEAALRREGLPGFRVTERAPDGGVVAAGSRPSYCVVIYVEPLAGNEMALGFDVGSEPRRRAALERAAATGQLTLTAGIRLVQDEQRGQGVLAFWPTRHPGPTGRELPGFIVGVFHVQDVVEAALARFESSALDVTLQDLTPGESSVLFESNPGRKDTTPFDHSMSFDRGGRTWRVTFSPTPAVIASHHTWVPAATLASGVAVSVLISLYLDVLIRRTRRITQLAKERAHEIERRKASEQERRRLDARLQQAQRLESLGVLAGGIAHDFNNLLTSMLGNADLALMSPAVQDESRELLEEIRAAALRAADLTRQILTYSGRATLSTTSLDLSALVEDLGEVLAASMPNQAQLRLTLAPDLPRIEADPTQLRQLIESLIANAGEALEGEPGVVEVSTRQSRFDREQLRDAYGEDAGEPGLRVLLEVADSGVGMTLETLDKIFDPFFSTRRDGRGLGLAAVRGVVQSHGGAIRCSSEPGKGTRVSVLFPDRAVDEAAGLAALPAEEWRADGTVLVVEDDEPIRSFVARVLSKVGFEVESAADGLAGVAVFRERPDEIVAVLLDMSMPRMSGGEALRAIRSIRPDARIVVASGYDKDGSLGDLGGERPDAFLQKPFTRGALVAALRAALEG